MLHPFKNDHVTWVTSREALPLLRRNPFISRLVTDDEITRSCFSRADTVVNLERDERCIEYTKACAAPAKFGYGGNLGSPRLYFDHATLKTWQERLYALMGRQWYGEPYVYVPAQTPAIDFDIGLNWSVGPKWPRKAWPMKNWRLLFQRFAGDHTISWQEGFDSLETYANWIASCDVIVTPDTLGLHLALALKKKVVALFGPTPAHEIPLYEQGVALSPDPYDDQTEPEMAELSVTRVEEALLTVLSKTRKVRQPKLTAERHP
jgi:heptosyltransferase-2